MFCPRCVFTQLSSGVIFVLGVSPQMRFTIITMLSGISIGIISIVSIIITIIVIIIMICRP